MHSRRLQHSIRRTMPAVIAVTLFAASAAALAQTPPESAAAEVARLSPGTAAYSEAIAKRLQVPAGFEVRVFASGLKGARMMDVAADGTVFVTRRNAGDVITLRDTDGDGRADEQATFASIPGVHGIAIKGGVLYLASSETIWRSSVSGGPIAPIVQGLPDGGQHPNRTVRVGPDGRLWVSVGSSCNDCAEENQLERATMIRYEADGSGRVVVANGLRNTIGYDWHPASGALWGVDNGSDFRGDDIPPEELNLIEQGRNYGWPICYGAREVDAMTNARPEKVALLPGQSQPSGEVMSREAFCSQTEPARLVFTAHSAPIAMRFYQGKNFPAAYRGDALVALRGSWNRSQAVGYKVIRIRFGPAGEPLATEDFVSGFFDAATQTVLGRPVGIAIAADGALLVSDDTNGAIYRISALPGGPLSPSGR